MRTTTAPAESFAGTAASIASWILLWSPLPDRSTVTTRCCRKLVGIFVPAVSPSPAEAEQRRTVTAKQRQTRANNAAVAAALLVAGELTRFNSGVIKIIGPEGMGIAFAATGATAVPVYVHAKPSPKVNGG
jgi:hypothetical protein